MKIRPFYVRHANEHWAGGVCRNIKFSCKIKAGFNHGKIGTLYMNIIILNWQLLCNYMITLQAISNTYILLECNISHTFCVCKSQYLHRNVHFNYLSEIIIMISIGFVIRHIWDIRLIYYAQCMPQLTNLYALYHASACSIFQCMKNCCDSLLLLFISNHTS